MNKTKKCCDVIVVGDEFFLTYFRAIIIHPIKLGDLFPMLKQQIATKQTLRQLSSTFGLPFCNSIFPFDGIVDKVTLNKVLEEEVTALQLSQLAALEKSRMSATIYDLTTLAYRAPVNILSTGNYDYRNFRKLIQLFLSQEKVDPLLISLRCRNKKMCCKYMNNIRSDVIGTYVISCCQSDRLSKQLTKRIYMSVLKKILLYMRLFPNHDIFKYIIRLKF